MEGFFLLVGVLFVIGLLFFVVVTASATIGDWFDDEHAKEFDRDALNKYLDDCERKHMFTSE